MIQPRFSGTARLLVMFCISALLAGCSAWFNKPGPGPVAMVASCPQPKPYPLAFQKQAAQELREYGAKIPATATLVGDYKSLRAALRDCGTKPGLNP